MNKRGLLSVTSLRDLYETLERHLYETLAREKIIRTASFFAGANRLKKPGLPTLEDERCHEPPANVMRLLCSPTIPTMIQCATGVHSATPPFPPTGTFLRYLAQTPALGLYEMLENGYLNYSFDLQKIFGEHRSINESNMKRLPPTAELNKSYVEVELCPFIVSIHLWTESIILLTLIYILPVAAVASTSRCTNYLAHSKH